MQKVALILTGIHCIYFLVCRCVCPQGFEGQHCQNKVDYCLQQVGPDYLTEGARKRQFIFKKCLKSKSKEKL